MNNDVEYRSENCLFLPLRKLNYRAVLFVAVDFHTDDREEINLRNMVEAFQLAGRYNCCRLTLPANPLYERLTEKYHDFSTLVQLAHIVFTQGEKIDFNLDLVLQQKGILSEMDFVHHWKSISEREPYSLKLQKTALSNCRASRMNQFSGQVKKRIYTILTRHNPDTKLVISTLDKMIKKLGDSYETGIGRGHIGYRKELNLLLRELPWNKKCIETCLLEIENG